MNLVDSGGCFHLLKINEPAETPSYLIRAPADLINGLGLHHNRGVMGDSRCAAGENRLRRNVTPAPDLPHLPPMYSR